MEISIVKDIKTDFMNFIKCKYIFSLFLMIAFANCSSVNDTSVLSFEKERTVKELIQWKFFKGDHQSAARVDFNDAHWESVIIPHDWAIKGPFDKEIDKQNVAIIQNGENIPNEKTGRTGALPFLGVGWYRTNFTVPELPDNKKVLLIFDGAMSNAEVYVNGKKVGKRPFGYSYFYFDISESIESKRENTIAVRLENLPQSSRWYPGAGLYRNVRLLIKDKVSFKQWGQFITTPRIDDEKATVNIRSTVNGEDLKVKVTIRDAAENIVATGISSKQLDDSIRLELELKAPKLWSPETPNLYSAELQLYQNDVFKDAEIIPFGIRSIKYSAEKGFELNGEVTKFKGVCLHHDLGPLGAALNTAALRRQLTILKDLGCNAIRSSHNIPSHEQLQLCDEMGFLFLAESFDEWKEPKMKNGYNLYFEEWAEKDIINLVRATRNHPSIVMWSSGNEIIEQFTDTGATTAKWLQEIFHKEDPTRPVTVGMDQVKAVMESGFGAVLDIPGLNYRVHLYEEAYNAFPQDLLLGSETASTVSSRGVYKFPVEENKAKTYDDYQCSSYDLTSCSWSNIPEDDFIMQDDKPWVIGEFVWTGFDYLGEPTPYDMFWPSRSSYFGILDLAGLPKDRYYLYRSRWNTSDETLHILPHWNWKGREGKTTPVFVYTNYNSAELFVNGKSQGIRTKDKNSRLDRYRLRWMDVKYEPGTLKVVAFDDDGKAVAEKEMKTAGKPDHLVLEADRNTITADGKDISFVTVSVVDKDGNLCPNADNQLDFEVTGSAVFKAVCNGDATSLDVFHEPNMKTFSGQLVVLVQATKNEGTAFLTVKGKGLKSNKIELETIKKFF